MSVQVEVHAVLPEQVIHVAQQLIRVAVRAVAPDGVVTDDHLERCIRILQLLLQLVQLGLELLLPVFHVETPRCREVVRGVGGRGAVRPVVRDEGAGVDHNEVHQLRATEAFTVPGVPLEQAAAVAVPASVPPRQRAVHLHLRVSVVVVVPQDGVPSHLQRLPVVHLREALLEERVGRAVEAVLVKIVARADDELGAERIHDAAH
mmetsp:Transcript_1899/g.6822  ORF Transcript_1899/g.6822 Transcript_1899/m.6822 type:complete len:205 (-) Transcript_1899:534-1148(-)